ncbi:MAG: tetratricopeptide repeat protein [Saprospiraceae bacterium]
MNEERNTQIETYLLGRMSAAERVVFEKKLTTDTSLANALREQEMDHDVMEAVVEMDLFRNLKTWQKEANKVTKLTSQKEAKIVPLYRRFSTLAIAASFLLLISAAFWLFQSETNLTPDNPTIAQTTPPAPTPVPPIEVPVEEPIAETGNNETPTGEDSQNTTPIETPKVNPSTTTSDYLAIADTYNNPLQLGTIRSGGTENDLLTAALEDLKNGRLAQGIEKLNTLIAEEPTNADAHYYLGLAQYQQKNYSAAIAPLQMVSTDPFYLESEKAQWYLVLAYLQNGQKSKAKAAIKELVADTEHSYHIPAKKIAATL